MVNTSMYLKKIQLKHVFLHHFFHEATVGAKEKRLFLRIILSVFGHVLYINK